MSDNPIMTSIRDLYDKINDLLGRAATPYTTDEHLTGRKWIDGKPIYEKTINFGALPNTAIKSVAHGISNLDYIINFQSVAKSANGVQWQPNYIGTVTSDMVAIWANKTLIVIKAYCNRSDFSCYVTLQYTKTV